MSRGNRGQRNENDTYLTPRPLLEALGPFDFDPCCPPAMPWRTARVMLTNEELKGRHGRSWAKVFPRRLDGLSAKWVGFTFLNPGFSEILPWAERMNEHRDGIVLTPAKSTDTVWCQRILKTCDMVRWLDDRISFFYPDGSPTASAWSPYMLSAYGKRAVKVLERLDLPVGAAGEPGPFPGVNMVRR